MGSMRTVILKMGMGAVLLGMAALPVQAQDAGAGGKVAGTPPPSQTSYLRDFTGPPSLAPLAERLSRAVVNIAASPKRKKEAGKGEKGKKGDEDMRRFFDRRRGRPLPPGHPPPRRASLGSGFIIDSSGIIVTNNHVIENAGEIVVRLHDGTRLKATLRGRDPKTDIAVLMVKPKEPLPWVEFGDSDAVHVGDWVLAIGNPFGLGGTVTTGIVSARNRDINAGPYDDFIQTDAAINKGNSGGPLFDMKGRVIGVNSAILSPTGGSVGIGFAIPSNLAKRVVDQLVKFGETRRGWLGVRIQTITDELAEGLGLKSPEGALVTEVTPGGPAAKAGIRPRDVIIEFNGRLVRKMRELPRLVAETPVGEEVPVKVIRDGREVALKVTLGRLEEAEKKGLLARKGKAPGAADGKAPEKVLGMRLAALDEAVRKEKGIPSSVKSGLVVLKVDAESQAGEKGLMPGDVIAEAGGRVLKSVADLQAALKRMRDMGRKAIPLLVLRKANNYEPQFVALKLGR